jgi:hypothetical protein
MSSTRNRLKVQNACQLWWASIEDVCIRGDDMPLGEETPLYPKTPHQARPGHHLARDMSKGGSDGRSRALVGYASGVEADVRRGYALNIEARR